MEDLKAYDRIVGHWQKGWSKETNYRIRTQKKMIQMFYEDNENYSRKEYLLLRKEEPS